ncbi:MAG: long-chain-fatty-acid--CoA ligase [Actinomycetota bacterium]|nr:long-chain-fatty-acid--CoA ligase [Actinomycetota bacterium]
MDTIAQLVRVRADDDNVGLRFGADEWTYREMVAECATRAAFLESVRTVRSAGAPVRSADAPFHVGVLLDNVPEFWFMLGACAMSGATLVGINNTRRGAELTRDITHTECALVVTESAHLAMLENTVGPVYVSDEGAWAKALAPFVGSPLPADTVTAADTYMLIFTSGTTGAPKAVRISHGKLAGWGSRLAENFGLGPADNCYSVMPLFHSNAQVAGFTAPLAAGATTVLRPRFSASGWLPDVREYGITFFNYVGKPLTYILATPELPDDAENSLNIAFGNEAAPLDIDRFAQRFGCFVADGYGSTEGGINMGRAPGTPQGSLGQPVEPYQAVVLDPETMEECPRARFDDAGRFLNPAEAIGEMVNPSGPGAFEGYYKNPEADAERMRGGMYWTGDLGYRDADGYFYFAGRNSDWLRVDGENFAAAPVENIVARHPDVVLAAVYAVPSPDVGDDVMIALHLRDGASFDPNAFATFCTAQGDFSPKWLPRYVRVSESLPSTATQKVLKRVLRQELWDSGDPVWWRPGRETEFRQLTDDDAQALRAEFEARGRDHLLGR